MLANLLVMTLAAFDLFLFALYRAIQVIKFVGGEGEETLLPLYGLRVTWSTVSSERCPLFAPLDTAAR